MSELYQTVAAYCQKHQLIALEETLVIGVSGGADSLCLLALLRQLATPYRLRLHVAHLNHQLRGSASDGDAAYVAEVARQWGLPCTLGNEDVTAFAQHHRLNLEDAARQCRYRFLAQTAQQIGATKIAVGHHADDQAETVLLRLLRGSGRTGLRGMQPQTPLGDLFPELATTNLSLIRPLLATPRAEIEAFCQAHNLTPRHDHSNDDRSLTRNRIRHELIPQLQNYNPNIAQLLTQTAEQLTAEDAVLHQALDHAWAATLIEANQTEVRFSLSAWRQQPLALQRELIRRGVMTLLGHRRDLDFDHIEQAITLLHADQPNTSLSLPHRLTLQREYNTFALTTSQHTSPSISWPHLADNQAPLPVQMPGFTPLPGSDWQLHLSLLEAATLPNLPDPTRDPWCAYFDADTLAESLVLRPRQPGDRFAPFGLGGQQQKLKTFMINAKIPPAVRGQVPLLAATNGPIYWVCGWRTDHHSQIKPSTQRIWQARFEKLP